MVRDLIVYKENKPKVKRALQDGRIDYLDMTKWGFIDQFFAFLLSVKFLEWCASTYPTPRKKEEVPAWFILTAAIQMKLHTTASFNALPGILRSGSILSRTKFNIGKRHGGFNYKNKKEREIPVHLDTVRKFFKGSDSDKIEHWVNHDVVKWLRRYRAFDKRGLFILDHTFLPLPENENYENAVYMPLDEHGNLVDVDKLSEAVRKKFKYTLCYGLTTLLHVTEVKGEEVYIFAGAHLGGGNESPLKAGEKLVDDFVTTVGKGVIKLLIMDRGFLDGGMTERFKKEYKIDTLIPIRSDMDILEDVKGLMRLKEHRWVTYKDEKDNSGETIYLERVTKFKDIRSWESCDLPLCVGIMETREKGKDDNIWGLISTKEYRQAKRIFDDYRIRAKIEERFKQLKLCWRIYKFTSTAYSLVTTHVMFTLLTYTLIQMYLMRKDFQRLANKTIDTLRYQERLGRDAVIVYAKGNFALFETNEYTEIILELEEASRVRLLKWVKMFKKRKTRGP